MRTFEISCLSSKYNELRKGLKITNESVTIAYCGFILFGLQ